MAVGVSTTSTGPEPGTRPRRSLRSRRAGLVLALLAAVLVAVVLSLAVGSLVIPPGRVLEALLHPAASGDADVVRSLRVPRTLLGLVVGAALGVAGALAQGFTRNPLADPGLLGITSGAAFLVVLAIFLGGVASFAGYIWFALAGAALAGVLVFLLGASGRAGGTPVTLALAGAALSAVLLGLTTAVVLSDQTTLDQYRFWSVGSLSGRAADTLIPVLFVVVPGLLLALATAPGLNALALGDDVARSLGVPVGAIRIVGLVAITLLAGGATAAAGPIAFVGLVVPHVVRAVTGPDYRWLLPCAALAGMVLILVADVVGRVVAPPGELQVGVVLAVVGAPFFVALVRRRRLAAA
ncbi:iron ABC transporter permease [Actinomycetospora endophytica]|uniref:Iron ABC transporter permease n=1 Tax=Actinomycetospora endophytica TaxID=2291215 RepID=A0ABS8PJJ7_9PSEU|nr:iron ABC transporter permease [Actinomycetospora endophytica]MCD2197591.1 iron ABC transporter permease [Actinomycetospora endophytica]